MRADTSDGLKLSVGSLLGLPLGVEAPAQPVSPEPATAEPPRLTTEEGPATIAAGDVAPARSVPAFRTNGVEDLTYDNPFNVSIEQVWFDHKVVYAVDMGQV